MKAEVPKRNLVALTEILSFSCAKSVTKNTNSLLASGSILESDLFPRTDFKLLNPWILGGIMKLRVVLAAFISLVISNGAIAGERYLVVLKSNQSYKAANTAFLRKVNPGLFRGYSLGTSFNAFSKVDAKVEDSLENINTLVVNAEGTEIAKLQGNADVALIEKEVFHPAPKPMKGFTLNGQYKNLFDLDSSSAAPAAPWGIAAVRAPQAWSYAHNKGSGARVLVLDTGIDANHPSLRANYEKGLDFTGESDGSDVTDTVGHGTHVSGTIAGVQDSSGFTGVAPQAKILMGRVCMEKGCSNVAIAQGINWGISEKVDVISMSLGGKWSTPAERAAISSADQAGISIVAASGNDGTNLVSYPAALPTVIAVGAVNSNYQRADFSQYGPELTVVAPGVAVMSSVPQGTGLESEVYVVTQNGSRKVLSTTFQGAKFAMSPFSTTLVYAGTGKTQDFANINVAGKLALISRGEISFAEKIKNAMAARAAGIVFYNNAPGLISGAVTSDGSTLNIYMAMVEQTVGEELKAELLSGRSASASLRTVRTNYSSFDGTSMATPHVAGVVALMKAANKSLKPADVKSILQETAQHLSGPNSQNELGAGLVDAEAAVRAAVSL